MEKVQMIIDRARQIYKFVPPYNDIVKEFATINIQETSNGLHIGRITFANHDKIIMTSSSIQYIPNHGDTKVLMEYKDYDDFLEKTSC